MNKIITKENFSEKVVCFEVEAPLIAKSRKAGHFVIVRVGKRGNVSLTPSLQPIPKRVPLRWLSSTWVNRLKRFAGWK